MYDYCIIGSGIAGKYLFSFLKDYNTLFIGADSDIYKDTNNSIYNLNSYIGKKDTWSEKATGLISFPDFKKDHLGILNENTYNKLATEICGELKIFSMEIQSSDDVKDYNDELTNRLNLQNYSYFHSAFDSINSIEVLEREQYDKHWLNKKLKWSFLDNKSTKAYARHFVITNNRAELIVDIDGVDNKISAKHFIIACHTPGTINLIRKTYEINKEARKYLKYVGSGFCDHPQLSFGLILKDMEIRRDLPPAMIFKDDTFEGIRYRIEVHNGPPLHHHTNYDIKKYPTFNTDKESRNFLRVSVVIEIPSQIKSILKLKQDEKNNVEYEISKHFYNFLSDNKEKIINHVRSTYFNNNVVILNDQDWYFSCHLAGGTSDKKIINDDFSCTIAENISIASQSSLSTIGLFNPTFTLLVICKSIVNRILKERN